MDYKGIKVSEETHQLLKELSQEDGTPVYQIVANFVNAAIARVNHAKKIGTLPEEQGNQDEWTESIPDSYVKLFCALHHREVGTISEKQFQANINDIGALLFARELDVVELDSKLSTVTPEQRKVMELELKLREAKKELELKTRSEDK